MNQYVEQLAIIGKYSSFFFKNTYAYVKFHCNLFNNMQLFICAYCNICTNYKIAEVVR